MTFNVRISTDNVAFEEDNLGLEIARILRGVADEIESGVIATGETIRLRDSNGNRVGFATLSED